MTNLHILMTTSCLQDVNKSCAAFTGYTHLHACFWVVYILWHLPVRLIPACLALSSNQGVNILRLSQVTGDTCAEQLLSWLTFTFSIWHCLAMSRETCEKHSVCKVRSQYVTRDSVFSFDFRVFRDLAVILKIKMGESPFMSVTYWGRTVHTECISQVNHPRVV